MKKLLLIISACFLAFTSSFSQFEAPKFGKIEMSDLKMTQYDKDTTAGALILFDDGQSHFTVDVNCRFQFIYERHVRIKVFKQTDANVGDFIIRLNKKGEYISEIKGVTYNLVDGKIVKTNLNNDKIYKVEGKYYIDKRFALPDIKEGSIIELYYSITSGDLYNLRKWDFQYHYPALWSQYKSTTPDYFTYRQSSKGYLPFDVNKTESNLSTFSCPSGSVSTNSTKTTLAVKNVPAFISEPHIDCEKNYMQSIEYELSRVYFPLQIEKTDYTQSWESVNKDLKESSYFGILLKSSGFIKDTVSAICAKKTTEKEKAIAIYDYVQQKLKWNGYYDLGASQELKKNYLEKVGNSADINLLLTLMLKTAGLKANAVVFSTRDNGTINDYPTISKFNSVLCQVELDGAPVLLDATNKYCPFGLLPANDINGRGRVVNDVTGDWVNLEATEKYKEVKSYNLEISDDGKLKGSIIENHIGYSGVEFRTKLGTEKTQEDYIRKMQENTNGLTINKYSIANVDDNYNPIIDTLNVEIKDRTQLVNNKILFKPLLFEGIQKNEFTLEDRKYPVDYNFLTSKLSVFDYTIPAGYEVESLPQSMIIKLPDNSMSIVYSIQNIDNKIKVLYKLDINKILFLPEEYQGLKELYNRMVKKATEQVILKKTVS
jgi:hypothetical protein